MNVKIYIHENEGFPIYSVSQDCTPESAYDLVVGVEIPEAQWSTLMHLQATYLKSKAEFEEALEIVRARRSF